MKRFLILLLVSCAVFEKVSSSGVTIGITPYSHPVISQYHSQDVLGQYVYGYVTPTSSKSETKTADGVTHGGYSYVDSNGILQTVEYVADAVNGFRVAATNLPQDLPDVAYAKAQHLAQVEVAKAELAQAHYASLAAVSPPAPLVALPAPVQDLPEVVRARAEHLAAFEVIKARDLAAGYHHAYAQNSQYYVPAVPTNQHHAQDVLGQYSYGYVGPLSSKSESKTADGVVRGGYSYLDANGIIQTVNYVSDDVNGFRVAATNIPVGLNAITPVVNHVPDARSNLVIDEAPAVGLYKHVVYY